jgi:hypothetical protein
MFPQGKLNEVSIMQMLSHLVCFPLILAVSLYYVLSVIERRDLIQSFSLHLSEKYQRGDIPMLLIWNTGNYIICEHGLQKYSPFEFVDSCNQIETQIKIR